MASATDKQNTKKRFLFWGDGFLGGRTPPPPNPLVTVTPHLCTIRMSVRVWTRPYVSTGQGVGLGVGPAVYCRGVSQSVGPAVYCRGVSQGLGLAMSAYCRGVTQGRGPAVYWRGVSQGLGPAVFCRSRTRHRRLMRDPLYPRYTAPPPHDLSNYRLEDNLYSSFVPLPHNAWMFTQF